MRRKEKEISEILKIIDKCKVCRLAITDKNKAYIVPLNYGYTYKDKILTLFFHSALAGRKTDLMKKNPDVCFEMDIDQGLVKGKTACEYSYFYQSVIGEGKINFIEDKKEKTFALNQIIHHQTETDEDFIYDENSFSKTLVYKLTANEISAKSK